MEVVHIKKDKNGLYERFLRTSLYSCVEQSLYWKKFQERLSFRSGAGILAIKEIDEYLMSATYTIIPTAFGKNYLHVNRGPAFQKELLEDIELLNIFELLQSALKNIAKKNNCIYIRFDFPFSKIDGKLFDFEYTDLLRKAHYSFQPKRTLLLDLEQTEEDLLKQMKPKGRYNIKVAEKNNVKIIEETSCQGVEEFYKLMKYTTKRDGFACQPKVFYLQMLEELKSEGFIKIYLAKYSNKIISATIVTFFGNRATYYYGASSNEYRNMMAPYLLQWRAIKDAKKEGLKWYDFLGIAENDDKKNSLAGVTGFKRKFGGIDFDYAESREIVVDRTLYYLLVGAKKAKNIFKKIFL